MSTSSLLPTHGHWIRRGGEIVLLPGAPARNEGELEGEVPVTATRAGVIDSRIDVHAQYALLRMAKGDPSARADAAGMLGAVKLGTLAGIYKEDQQVPALRARRQGIGWWQLIPPGRDAAVVHEPRAAPIIVFRDRVRSDPARLDHALRAAWAELLRSDWMEETIDCTVPAVPAPSPAGQGEEPLPRLCLWQNHSVPSVAGSFRNMATLWARQIRALQVEPGAPRRDPVVGPSRYDSGEDVVAALEAAAARVGKVAQVHFFGHSGSAELFGRDLGTGIVVSGPLNSGAVLVTQIPAGTLHPDVAFVFHGCFAATGDTNLARTLFEHLDAQLPASVPGPRVYGHPRHACVGMRQFWREYSRGSRLGQRRTERIPIYSPPFCPDLPTRQSLLAGVR